MYEQKTIDDFRESKIYKQYFKLFFKKIETNKEAIYWQFYRPEKHIDIRNPLNNILEDKVHECPRCGLILADRHFWFFHPLLKPPECKKLDYDNMEWVHPSIAFKKAGIGLSEDPFETCEDYMCHLCMEEKEGTLTKGYLTRKILKLKREDDKKCQEE